MFAVRRVVVFTISGLLSSLGINFRVTDAGDLRVTDTGERRVTTG